jgi:hypothetical protein
MRLKTFLLGCLVGVAGLSGQQLRADVGDGYLELRAAAFFPTSGRYKDIYGDVAAAWEIQGGYQFADYWAVFANLDYVSDEGRSVGRHDRTHARILNFSLGPQVLWPFCGWWLYLGAGPSFGGIWLHNHAHCSKNHVSKGFVGFVVKPGIGVNLGCRWFLDLFSDYLWERVDFDEHIQLGGWKLGGGIGVKF